jgi:hypothetical protein
MQVTTNAIDTREQQTVATSLDGNGIPKQRIPLTTPRRPRSRQTCKRKRTGICLPNAPYSHESPTGRVTTKSPAHPPTGTHPRLRLD